MSIAASAEAAAVALARTSRAEDSYGDGDFASEQGSARGPAPKAARRRRRAGTREEEEELGRAP